MLSLVWPEIFQTGYENMYCFISPFLHQVFSLGASVLSGMGLAQKLSLELREVLL